MDSRPLEYNIILVKWGDKFSSEHVNRIYRMAKKNLTLPFSLYCHTDDATGIYDSINIIKLDESLPLEKWWWKLTLFKKNKLPEGINLFLDLDVVIQNNIDHLFSIAEKNKLVIIDKMHNEDGFYIESHTIPFYNSSIMIWYNNDHQDIWEKFSSDMNLYFKLYSGIDRFFSYEINSSKFKDVGIDNYYYRANGRKIFNIESSQIVYHNDNEYKLYYDESRPICVFNSCHEDFYYQGMENYLL